MNEKEHDVRRKYRTITEELIRTGRTITTMESCTGGLITSLITDTEGASAVLNGAFVTYSNSAKIACGVPAEVIAEFGVYSSATAEAMAETAMKRYDSDYSVGITGSFGNPDPANRDSIPGIVYIAVCDQTHTFSKRLKLPLSGSRYEDKIEAADAAADLLLDLIGWKNER